MFSLRSVKRARIAEYCVYTFSSEWDLDAGKIKLEFWTLATLSWVFAFSYKKVYMTFLIFIITGLK